MKVKILEIYEHQFYSDDHTESLYQVGANIDWDEISDEDFTILHKWVRKHNEDYRSHTKYVIVTEANLPIPKLVKSFIERARKETEEKEERERKVKEAAEKRAKTLEKKRQNREIKLLEELMGKYEVPSSVIPAKNQKNG